MKLRQKLQNFTTVYITVNFIQSQQHVQFISVLLERQKGANYAQKMVT